MFRALVLEEAGGTVTPSIRELDEAALPAGNVTVAVEYTTVNYKDGLVVSGAGGLIGVPSFLLPFFPIGTRSFPAVAAT